MEFVNPGFLFGLFAIAVPVIIHLFNFRRFRKVYFTNVEFIRELKQETRKQSNLKHFLVLLSRILAIAAIVLAFARPYIPVEDNLLRAQEQNSVSIYIDNSFSMQAESEEGTLLQTAINKAREIVSIYKSSDRFQLLTNDFEGRHHRFVSREEFLDLLDQVELSPVVKDYDEVKVRISDLQRMDGAKVRTAYILSDFQVHFLRAAEASTDTLMSTFFVPVQSVSPDNIYIDSCWFESPVQQINQNVKMLLRVKNSSGNSYEDLPVKLSINGMQRALASFTLDAGGESLVELSYTNTEPGIQAGELEINDYPISFDDRVYFSYLVNDRIRILSVNEGPSDFYLNSLFRGDSTMEFENMAVDQLNFSGMQDYQFIVLNGLSTLSTGLIQEVQRFLAAGGSLLVLPPSATMDNTYNDLLRTTNTATYGTLDTTKQRVGSINLEHPLYEGVFDDVPENMDLPVVERHYRLSPMLKTSQQVLMKLQNGDVFLALYPVDRGRLYLSAVPLQSSFSNFQQHPVFVPTLFKMAVTSSVSEPLYYVLGRNEVIRVEQVNRSQDEVLRIKDAAGTFEVIPEHRRVGHMDDLFVYGQIAGAGNYFLVHSGEPIRGLSFNYDRMESEMIFDTPDDLKQLIADRQLGEVRMLDVSNKPLSSSLEEMSRGIQLWKWFVLAALAFLLTETVLLRFMK